LEDGLRLLSLAIGIEDFGDKSDFNLLVVKVESLLEKDFVLSYDYIQIRMLGLFLVNKKLFFELEPPVSKVSDKSFEEADVPH
jgi:hypothetical protein